MSHAIQVDINLYLFGDILGIGWVDVAALGGLAVIVLGVLYMRWRALLMVTVEPNIAAVEGVHVARMQLLLTVMLAAVIALAIKLVGVLLITALLIIPAAAARYLAKSPKQMALLASVIGMASSSAGLFASLKTDAPTAPMMVAAAALAFVLCGLIKRQALRA